MTPLIEVGVTGRAIEVDVEVSPNILHDLGVCEVGSSTTTIVTLLNKNTLPLQFNFSKIAHFVIKPYTGKMTPGEQVDVEITFSPSQFGSFSKKYVVLKTILHACTL